MKKILPIIALLSWSQTVYCQDCDRYKISDKIKVGDPCPQFSLTGSPTTGSIQSNSFKGSVTFINFFATWCGPCLQELPEVEKRIWSKYKDNKNFRLVVIGRGHGQQDVEKFKMKYGFTFPMYPDSTKTVFEAFTDKYIPRSFIVDKRGVIVYSSVSYSEPEFGLLIEKLDELLK